MNHWNPRTSCPQVCPLEAQRAGRRMWGKDPQSGETVLAAQWRELWWVSVVLYWVLVIYWGIVLVTRGGERRVGIAVIARIVTANPVDHLHQEEIIYKYTSSDKDIQLKNICKVFWRKKSKPSTTLVNQSITKNNSIILRQFYPWVPKMKETMRMLTRWIMNKINEIN